MATVFTDLPPAKAVRDLLEGLLGKDTTFSDGDRLTDPAKVLLGVYVDDQLALRALIAMDVGLAASVGAAIGLMPMGGVEDAIGSGELFPLQQDNAAEVLNIMASLFNVGSAPHLRLYGYHGPQDDTPTDVAAKLPVLGGRVDWRVSLKGYPGGKLSILLV